MDNIRQYIYDLLAQAGFTEEDNLEMLADDLEPVLLDRIMAKIALRLSEADQNSMYDMLDEWKAAEFHQFVAEKIENYDVYFAAILDEFTQDYLADFVSSDAQN